MKTKVSIVIPFKIERSTGAMKEVYVWTQLRESVDVLNGLDEFPGGKAHSLETEEEVAIREVKEETGVLLEKVELFKRYSFSGNLYISVFLYQDLGAKFEKSRYKTLENVRKSSQIPPNNKTILDDLVEYFQ